MIREQLQKLNTDAPALRRFGLLIGGLFLLVGAWLLWRRQPAWPYLLGPGIALLGLGLTVPRRLRHIYVAWMILGFLLGTVVSLVLLTLIYFLVVTPIGWLARGVGKDFLDQKREPGAASYWLPRDRSRPRPPADYERQF